MNISYKRDMTHNYMVPDLTEGICEDDYRIHMLTENHIRGLLPCQLKKINCRSHFFYDITSRQSMKHIYDSRCLNVMDIRKLLHGLYRALKEVKKYLLDVDRIVLQPDMIYMDIETREPFFCYLPGYHSDLLHSFRELTAYLLEHLDQTDNSAVLLGYEIYRKARIENYSLEKLLREAGCGGSECPPDPHSGQYPTQEQYFNGRAEPSRGYYEEPQANHKEASSDFTGSVRGFTGPSKDFDGPTGFARLAKDPDGPAGFDRSLKDFDRPSKGFNGPAKGFDRSAKNSDRSSKGFDGPPKNFDDFADAKLSASSAGSSKKKTIKKTGKSKKGKNAKKESEKQSPAKAKASSRVFLIVCFGFAIFLALISMWLWNLDTTQIGGIIFLLVGLLAYGFSLEGKKKKGDEKKKDEALAKAMEDFQEEPYHEETLPPRKSRYTKESSVYEPASGYDTDSRYSSEPEYNAGSRFGSEPKYNANSRFGSEPKYCADSRFGSEPKYCADSRFGSEPKYCADSRLGSEPKYCADSRLGSEPKYNADSRFDSAFKYDAGSQKSRLGDTGVLFEENGDYEPHLVLVSMDPRRKDNIVLENDCYIIGKLSSQSDIVLEHSSVSRVHAKIERCGNDYYICDLNSTNGTFLNGQRLAIREPVKIQPNDEIAFARMRYRVGIC